MKLKLLSLYFGSTLEPWNVYLAVIISHFLQIHTKRKWFLTITIFLFFIYKKCLM